MGKRLSLPCLSCTFVVSPSHQLCVTVCSSSLKALFHVLFPGYSSWKLRQMFLLAQFVDLQNSFGLSCHQDCLKSAALCWFSVTFLFHCKRKWTSNKRNPFLGEQWNTFIFYSFFFQWLKLTANAEPQQCENHQCWNICMPTLCHQQSISELRCAVLAAYYFGHSGLHCGKDIA